MINTVQAIIYRATNAINEKIYVGYTTLTLKRRRWQHEQGARLGSETGIARAIRKHGASNFIWDILFVSFDKEFCLNIAEPALIDDYDSFRFGYNMTIGGHRGPVLAGDLNGMFGKTHTLVVRMNLGIRASKRFKGRSYADLYGKEEALRLRAMRSKQISRVRREQPYIGAINPNYDPIKYTFIHISGPVFVGTIFELRQVHLTLSKENTSRIKRGGTSKGWSLQ